MNSLILATAARLLTPLMLVFSLYLMLRGHNNPGGGFAGGLVAASALMLHTIANGVAAGRRLLRFDPRIITIIGVAVSIVAGLLGLTQAAPFLTGVWLLDKPLAIGSPILFDIGVYLAVLGGIAAILLALEEER